MKEAGHELGTALQVDTAEFRAADAAVIVNVQQRGTTLDMANCAALRIASLPIFTPTLLSGT